MEDDRKMKKNEEKHDLAFTGERYIPNNDSYSYSYSENSMQHIQRYLVAKELCRNKKVLDIACGEGYGSDILSQTASSVYGVDISEEAVLHAQNKYQKDNLSFRTGSVAEISFDDESFDVVISFETIEHVSEELQIKFLDEIKRVLKKDGLLMMSSPDKMYYSDMTDFKNIYHVKELYEEEFYALLKKYFNNINMYYQGMLASSYIINDKFKQIDEIKKFEVIKGFSQYNAEINIAVCGNAAVPDIENSFIIDHANTYYLLKQVVYSLQNAIKDPAYIIEQKENYICEQRGLIEQHTNYIYDQNEIINELKNIKNQQEHELNIYRGFSSHIIIKILYKIYRKLAGK